MINHMKSVALLPIVMLSLLSACQPGSSPTSRELETRLIPKIIAWSKSREPVFSLAENFPAGKFELVCVVPDYRCLRHQKGTGRIDVYHSSFGNCIPENSSAIMLVSDNKAHAALIEMETLRIDVPYLGKCVSAADAILRMTTEPDVRFPMAALEQRKPAQAPGP